MCQEAQTTRWTSFRLVFDFKNEPKNRKSALDLISTQRFFPVCVFVIAFFNFAFVVHHSLEAIACRHRFVLKHLAINVVGIIQTPSKRQACDHPILTSGFVNQPGMLDSFCKKHTNVSCGVRTHAQLPAVDLKSTPLTSQAN